MKKYICSLFAMALVVLTAACSDSDLKGYPEVPALAKAQNLAASVSGRTVTLTWDLPAGVDVSAVRVSCDNCTPTVLPGTATSYVLKGQPMEQELLYTVKLEQQGGYVSEGVSVTTTVPYIASKMGFLLLADSPSELPDDDELAAAAWFGAQANAEFIRPEQISSLDPDVYSVLWIMVDRVGLELGWEHLPAALTSAATLAALSDYSAAGGSLYLSNMATQLAVPLGFVPATWNPTCYGNGDGGSGDDVWVINPYLGWDFRDGSDQGFYDRTGHAVYEGLTLEDPNNYGYPNLPLIGPGRREDHNCLWDCNVYGKGAECDVIRNFEVQTSSLVLATWGHVRDHCVAGLVEFYATTEHGQCIANGFAAYEWNQNSGTNPYQANIERLTANILNYLK